jgi:alpha-glucosidase (family GH31 glycosyl hydrolase)
MAMAGKLWPQMYADGVREAGGPDADKPLILSRNAWAGAAAHGVALWSSDISCTWTEFRAQVTVGLSSGLSGIPFWSSDVGGFDGTTTPELVARWHQFGSVCPLYRTHGSRPFNEPWSFGPETQASIVKSIRLRESLHPYIMAMASNATAYGTPLMVPLWFYFPTDPELQRREVVTEFCFGPKYLAAPVLEKGATTRTLYLPQNPGGWVHYYTQKKYSGGANVTVSAPYDELPLFIRG